MKGFSGKQVQEIIRLFRSNNSILETSKVTGVSTVKVRKILITEGLWESDTSIKIGKLLKQGLSTEEIAKELYMSVKNVQAYMPYERGLYGGEDQSSEAIRSDRYRKRMKRAAAAQVAKKADVEEEMNEMTEDKIIEFRQRSEEKQAQALRLHLELDMGYVDEEEMRLLQKYGSVENAISRDIIVPADITLHALHYVILRMFGWQNGHLHNFSLPKEAYEGLTENQFITWAKMVGVYFRFPTEDYEDIYWDDDYTESQSVKSWMKKKYTGPYKYKGRGEHYVNGQIEVKDMHTFADMMCYELIERLPLIEVLCIPGMHKIDYAKIRKNMERELSKIDIDSVIEEYQTKRFDSMKQEQAYLEQYDIPCQPVTKQLCYSYDYGDGWEVCITCEEAYTEEDDAWIDSKGKPQEALREVLDEVITKHCPICIEKDGIELVDDVGGIGGFCRMLQTIYECDYEDEEQVSEREDMLDWADMMGWTGRRISPKQTL